MIDPNSLDTLLHPTLDEKGSIEVIASGLPASPGAASGKVVFTSDEAERLNGMMQDTILVRVETSPEDIQGMHAAKGILTARGGMTSHAAVVARGMGRPCVSGSSEIDINYDQKTFKTSSAEVKEGDMITIDGSTGRIILGTVPTVKPEISGDFSKLMSWADKIRKLKVRTNSETPIDTKTARDFGAEGIGLCRTEHMFFEKKSLQINPNISHFSSSSGSSKSATGLFFEVDCINFLILASEEYGNILVCTFSPF